MARPGFLIQHALLDILAGEPPEIVGAYVLIHQFCARKNTGGRIVGAGHWNDGTWRCACRISKRHVELLVRAGGAEWEAADLVLEGYDQIGQDRYGRAVGRVEAINEKRRAGGSSGDDIVGRHRGTTSSHDIVPRHRGAKSGGGTAGAGAGEENSAPPPSSKTPRAPAPRQDSPAAATAGDYEPHEATGETTASEPPPDHLTTKIRVHRVDGVDPAAVRQAVKDRNLMALVGAFLANAALERHSDWHREADGVSLHELVIYFAHARRLRKPIREPSGLRKAKEEREAGGGVAHLAREDLHALLDRYGLKPPGARSATA